MALDPIQSSILWKGWAEMKGYQCTNCPYETMVEVAFCPQCRQQAFKEKEVPNIGEVYSFTTIRVAPPEFAVFAPYQVALVSLTDKLKITAFIQEDIAIGDSVILKEVREKAFVFKPVGLE